MVDFDKVKISTNTVTLKQLVLLSAWGNGLASGQFNWAALFELLCQRTSLTCIEVENLSMIDSVTFGTRVINGMNDAVKLANLEQAWNIDSPSV